ncbi:MAG: glycosyltransferase family 4 protein [Akkermansia sp.]|nr:glycosyltransferase family 4 protein [Akkermansia sp.]
MNIIAIGPQRFFSSDGFTGDATQMRKTTVHLKKVPEVNLVCAFYNQHFELTTETGASLEWEDLHKDFDVAHIFTLFHHRVPAAVASALSKLPVMLSTVYWNNYFRELICVRNGDSPRRLLRSIEHIARRITGYKKQDVQQWCAGILPNSWSEGEVFKQTYALAEHALCYPVPNAIEVPTHARNLPRPACVPESDYIVYPGVFARRKNQLAFIKALRDTDYPVVFMGQPQREYEGYYQECRKLANINMHFIGHRSYTDDEYWAVLRHAKIAVLASDCETPGIAMIEAASMGARPIITHYGGTKEYYGICAEYLSPFSLKSIKEAVQNGWSKGRLTDEEASSYERFSWQWTAELTLLAYKQVITNWNTRK